MNYRDFYKNNKRRPVFEEVEENILQSLNLEDPAVDDGLPKRADGSLDTVHDGRPIHLSKIVQIGAQLGKSANGALGGMTNVGVDEKSKGSSLSKGGQGVPVENDQEHITAGGEGVSSEEASKTVGGEVVNGGGQKQGGPNTVGSIAGTPKAGDGESEGDTVLSLQEAKSKLRNMVKEALKEISFNKKSGRWERITENHDAAGFPTDGTGRPQYKVGGPQYRCTDDVLARTRQYEPEITEMCDEEEVTKMNERYTELVTAQRNLSESELSELKDLGFKIEKRAKAVSEAQVNMKMGPSYKVVQPRQLKTSEPDLFARTNQFDPEVSEYGAPVIEPDVEPEVEPWKQPETEPEPEPTTPQEPEPTVPDPLQPERPGIAPRPRGYRTNEAGGGAVQHSSFRTAKDYPFGKNRHRNDIDESKKRK